MSEQTNFLDLVLKGQAQIDEIDDFVEKWHEGQSAADLSDYLGMRPDEYSLWLNNPELLALICAARRSGRPLVQAVNDEMAALRLAGRTGGVKLASLSFWLRRQGVDA